MKKNPALLYSLLVIILFSACTASPTESSSAPTASDLAPTPTAIVMGTSTPTPEPLDPGDLPSGVLSMGGGTDSVRLTTFDGEIVDEIQLQGFVLPSLSPSSPNHFHFGGTTDQGLIQTPCIFYSSVIYDKHISLHAAESPIIHLQQIEGLINLVGPSRLPLAVFSTYDPENLQYFNHNRFSAPPEDDSQPTSVPASVDSWLYSATHGALPESELLFTHLDENGYAIYPLQVEMEGETLKGVWHTLSYEAMHGGGPIIYSGQRGLYYLDAETKQQRELLSRDLSFLALSNNQDMLAYITNADNGAGTVIIQDLISGSQLEIGILMETHPTGVGNALFSPSDGRLAWQEHYLGDESPGIVFRIASTLTGDLLQIDSEVLIKKTGDPAVYHLRFAGWAGNKRMIVEAFSPDNTDLYLLNLSDRSLEFLAPGRFVGVTYP